jgi:putative ATP-binding cassette transporter
VNGDPVVYADNKRQYRSLYSPVFSDFHLFDQLYNVEDENEVNEYLKFFEIDHKVNFSEGKFSTSDLSTGQRKRLALIACIVENKPILVLDEWAADQDPVFRKKFYLEILPLLKSKGFTIIAITHDDAYFDTADCLFKMSEGALIKVK